jgi:mycothiol system anti-sigma-R factor
VIEKATLATMDCDHTIRQVYLYLDGELTTLRRWQITRHLNRCPPCQHGYDFEVELRHVVADRCHDQVPEALKHRIADAIGLIGTSRAPDALRSVDDPDDRAPGARA